METRLKENILINQTGGGGGGGAGGEGVGDKNNKTKFKMLYKINS